MHAVAQSVEAQCYKPAGRGSITDGVIWIFHWFNPSRRTVALGSIQPLKEMSTSSIFWGGVETAGA
jgi:hypothetical protein